MTKAERAMLQGIINRLGPLGDESDRIFKELQAMARDLGLPVYCSAKSNTEQLLKCDEPYTKYSTYAASADYLYEQYVEINAKKDMIRELGGELAKLGFFKSKK